MVAIHYQPLTTIKLYGVLRQFGREFRLAVRTPAEAIKALCIQIPGFERFIAESQRQGLEFAVFRDSKNLREKELSHTGAGEIRIAPVISGSKRGGVLQTVLGVVLLVISYVFPVTAPYLAPAGVGLIAGGVVQMLSPQASGLRQSASPDNLPSYAFGSARNTTASGNNVPICIGERRWGGAIISAAIYAEDKV